MVQAPVAGTDRSLHRGDRRGGLGARARRCSPSSRATNTTWSAWCRPRDIAKLAVNQPATDPASSAPAMSTARCAGSRRRSSPTASSARSSSRSPRNRRLLVNSSGGALIKTGQSCGVAVPLTAMLYGTAGTVVQVVRRDAGRDQAGRGRADVGRPGRDPRRPQRRRHRGGPRRRAAARRRSGAAGDGAARTRSKSSSGAMRSSVADALDRSGFAHACPE